jgi:hypothetical protein
MKMHLRPTDSITKTKVIQKDGALKAQHLHPGDMVSMDQYVSKQTGSCLPHMKGKEKESEHFVGSTIYIDEATRLVFVLHQVSLGAAEMIHGKHLFEREAGMCGASTRNYRGDNGVFKVAEYVKDLNDRGQMIKYIGVGAHHQNGVVAEHAIRTISESARAMLLHAVIHWPEETTLDLWPMAMDYAVYLWNHCIPRKDSGIVPLELFCKCKIENEVL